MRIGFVSTQRSWGGGEKLLSQLIAGLRQLGVEALLAAPCGSAMADWARDANIQLLELPGKGRGPKALWRLRQTIRSAACDVVLLNDPHAITYGGLATMGLGLPRIGVRHTVFPVRSGWKHSHLIDQVVCVSDAARQECLKAGVAAERIQVIHAGVAAKSPQEDQIAAARHMMNGERGSSDAKNLLAIGSLLPVKGFDTALRAVAQARDEGHAWRLWIAGEGPERESLTKIAKNLDIEDRVRLLGFREDINALLTAADLFVSASHNEGFSLVVVEAMLARCPIVATPVGGCREVLGLDQTPSPALAHTFSPGDSVALYQAAREVLERSDMNESRLEAAHAWAEQRFTIDRMARDYLTMSRRLAA